MGASITAWANALPEKIMTNADFEARLETSDEWIVERTGIRERHIGTSTVDIAVEAGAAAIKRANLSGADIDLLVLATTTPDKAIPASSSAVHSTLGLSGGAFDLNAACAGFVYSLVTADALVRGTDRRALLIGAETLTRYTDFEDRSTAVLFGDGAGAVVIEGHRGEELILSSDLGVDGTALPLLYAEHGGYIKMDGKEVFRRAVRSEINSITKVLEDAGLTPADIALFVPHQANVRIIEAINERIGFTKDQTAIVLDKTGNTSAASIPIALSDAADHGRVKDGDLVLLSGFGAGMTWASAIIRWGDLHR